MSRNDRGKEAIKSNLFVILIITFFILVDPRGEVVIRRCAVVGDCKYIAKNEKQSCHECAHDLCNDGK